MRIQLASDLHLEVLSRNFPHARLITPAPDADLLVLAGDISNGVRGVEMFAKWPVPVLYVAGNHEFYGCAWEQTRLDLRAAAEGTSVVVLDNAQADFRQFGAWFTAREAKLARLRILGTTLWTDYRLRTGLTQRRMMEAAEMSISDHFRIQTQQGAFTASQALDDHEMSRRWLEHRLGQPFDGKTIVVSHHAPHPNSIHPRWQAPATMALNSAFVSDLSPLLIDVDLWLHGHVHDSFSYQVGRCSVVANPRGYARNTSRAAVIEDLDFENTHFNGQLVIEV